MPRHSTGFTMIELLITIAILAILLTLGIPSFRDFILNSRMARQTNEFVLALAYAKSEAVKRGVRVVVCSRDNTDPNNRTCAASTNWDNGWLVFVDQEANAASAWGTINGADQVLQVRPTLEGGNTLRAGALERVIFLSTGFQPDLQETFNLCDTRPAASGRNIVVSPQGRVTTQTGAITCP